MKRIIATVFISALAVVPAAIGAHPGTTSNSVTIATSRSTVVFGSPVTIAGTVSGKKASGATAMLQVQPFGSSSFATVETGTADAAGHYSFVFAPGVNTNFRVLAKTAPPATSATTHVNVRVQVTIGVSTRNPKIGQKVRFSGFVVPAYNGFSVLIQRMTATGGWRTVTPATLAAATPIAAGPRSKYSKSLKITKSGTYRVRFVPPPGRLANNSGTRHLTVHS
jgi:hypothetical protein